MRISSQRHPEFLSPPSGREVRSLDGGKDRCCLNHPAFEQSALWRYQAARDLLSEVQSPACVFKYHLSAFVVAAPVHRGGLFGIHSIPSLLAVARPRVRFTRIATLTRNSTALPCRCLPAARKAGPLTRSNSRPTHRTGAETSCGPLGDALNWQAPIFYGFNTAQIVPCPRQISRIPKPQLLGIGFPPQTSFLSPYLELRFQGAPMYAAHVLRNHSLLITIIFLHCTSIAWTKAYIFGVSSTCASLALLCAAARSVCLSASFALVSAWINVDLRASSVVSGMAPLP